MKYRKEIIEIIRASITAGETYTQAIKRAGIAQSVFYDWKAKYPEFAEMIKDAEETLRLSKQSETEVGVHKAACGYDYTEVRLEFGFGANGQKILTKQVETTKHVPPNVQAAKMELLNLAPEKWGNSPMDDNFAGVRVEVVTTPQEKSKETNQQDKEQEQPAQSDK